MYNGDKNTCLLSVWNCSIRIEFLGLLRKKPVKLIIGNVFVNVEFHTSHNWIFSFLVTATSCSLYQTTGACSREKNSVLVPLTSSTYNWKDIGTCTRKLIIFFLSWEPLSSYKRKKSYLTNVTHYSYAMMQMMS